MERKSELLKIVRGLITKQRGLAASTNLALRFRTLWVAAKVANRLKQCADTEISELLSLVQERFHIFEPEFAICHHARQRLLPQSAKERLTQ